MNAQQRQSGGLFFGWYVVAGVFAAQLLVVGFFSYSTSLIVGPVRESFGVSLERVMHSLTLGTLAGLFVMPVCGILLDRYSARWLIALGILAFAGGLWAASGSAGIGEFVVWFGLSFALSNGLGGSMAASTTVSRWFAASRGRALGIAAIGTSAGGLAIPALVAHWLEADGWRGALQNLALAAVLLVLPLVLVSIRGRPEELGLEPECGRAANPAGAALTTRQILRMPAYWRIGLALGLLFCIYSAVLANLAPLAAALGFGSAAGSRLIMVLALASMAGKLCFGALADRLDLKLGLLAAIALVAGALLLLALQPGYALLALAAALLGLAAGGMLPVWGAMMASAFGLASYGRAMGLMGPVITLLVMPGYTLMGRLHDMTGGYQLGLAAFCGLCLLPGLLIMPLRLRDSGQAA